MNKSSIFSDTLRELRVQKGLTQEKLAEKADVNVKYYGRIERGQSFPTLPVVKKIIDALEIKLSEFMLLVEQNQN